MDNGEYYPKPMNCPMHCLIYRAGTKSYRDLPLRLFELGTVYRYERAGTLHGLMRIRGFTQDDAHIFTTEEGLSDEISNLLTFVMSVLSMSPRTCAMSVFKKGQHSCCSPKTQHETVTVPDAARAAIIVATRTSVGTIIKFARNARQGGAGSSSWNGAVRGVAPAP